MWLCTKWPTKSDAPGSVLTENWLHSMLCDGGCNRHRASFSACAQVGGWHDCTQHTGWEKNGWVGIVAFAARDKNIKIQAISQAANLLLLRQKSSVLHLAAPGGGPQHAASQGFGFTAGMPRCWQMREISLTQHKLAGCANAEVGQDFGAQNLHQEAESSTFCQHARRDLGSQGGKQSVKTNSWAESHPSDP
eukprot:1143294-Pelagomonas_calceolata.AAC.3